MLTLATLALLVGCTEDETEAEYAGGTFIVTIEDVQDDCYDGSFSVIFMPEGTPTEFQDPVEVPAFEDLPADSTLSLQAPFADLDVTWEAGDAEDQMVINEAGQTDVLLDEDSYGDCAVDMLISLDMSVLDADNISATATLTTSGFEEDDCPAVSADPCDISLVLTGVNTAASTEE